MRNQEDRINRMLVTVEVGDRYMGPHTQDRYMGALFILSLSAFKNFPNEKSDANLCVPFVSDFVTFLSKNEDEIHIAYH